MRVVKFGKQKRKKALKRRPVSALPEQKPYSLPEHYEEVDDEAYYCDDGHLRMHIRRYQYGSRIVAFSIQLCLVAGEAARGRCVYRVDCSMPEPDLHVHEFHPGDDPNDNTGDKSIICDIPCDGTGRDFVTAKYHEYIASTYNKSYEVWGRWSHEAGTD